MCLTLAYGAAVAPFTYAFSFLFKSSSSAGTTSLMLYILMGVILNIAAFILDLVSSTRDTNAKLKHLYYCFPPFNVGWGFVRLGMMDSDYWADDGIGTMMIYMGWTAVAW